VNNLDQFIHLCAHEILRRSALADEHALALSEGARALAQAAANSRIRSSLACEAPVVESLDAAASTPLFTAAMAARNELCWMPSPRLDDNGTEAALAPLNKVRDLPGVICGLLAVGPNGVYPEHSHPPQELYLPITGDGEWRYGGDTGVRKLARNALVYNNPDDVHAVYAGGQPLLAMYVLWPT